MAKNTAKKEYEKPLQKPTTQPIINKKSQQKTKKKPKKDKKNQQKAEIQKFEADVKKVMSGIKLQKKSIFQGMNIEIKQVNNKKQKQNIIIIQPILKNPEIGCVNPVTIKYNENGYTVDKIKKDILDAVKKPSYEISLAKPQQNIIKQAVIDMIKLSPDIAIDKSLICILEWPYTGFFGLVNSAVNEDFEQGKPISHPILNSIIDEDGNISFWYYQNQFSVKNVNNVWVVINPKKAEQIQTSEFINKNTDALKKCMALCNNKLEKFDDAASIRSLATDVDEVSGSPYTPDYLATDGQQKVNRGFPSIDDSIKIKAQLNTLTVLLKFHNKQYKKTMSDVVDYNAINAWIETIEDEEEALKQHIADRFRHLKISGSLLHRTILKMIVEREGREWPEDDPYEWIEDRIRFEISTVLDCHGISAMASLKDISEAAKDLISCGLLRKKDVRKNNAKKNLKNHEPFLPGARNVELIPGEDYMIFAEIPFERKEDSIENFNDFDWLDWLKNRMFRLDDSLSMSDLKNSPDWLSLLEHRCVVVACQYEMKLFFSDRPKSWVEYVEMMADLADSESEKYYWRHVISCVDAGRCAGRWREIPIVSADDYEYVFDLNDEDNMDSVSDDEFDDFGNFNDWTPPTKNVTSNKKSDDFDDFDDYGDF